MSAFTTAYAASTAAVREARAALDTAVKHSTPMEAELAAVLRAARPEAFADMEAKMAAIAATVPGLRAELDAAREVENALSVDACYNCQGTGDYPGRTRYLKNNRPVCFVCHGDGRSAAARRRG